MARNVTIKPGKESLLSPSDVIHKFPELSEKLGWTPNDIGSLLKMRILTGIRNGNKKITLIQIESLKPVIELVNKNFERSKITIK